MTSPHLIECQTSPIVDVNPFVTLRFPCGFVRMNGDTRRRKRRLRNKLDKKLAIRYGPAIFAEVEEIKRRVTDKIEMDLFRPIRIIPFGGSSE